MNLRFSVPCSDRFSPKTTAAFPGITKDFSCRSFAFSLAFPYVNELGVVFFQKLYWIFKTLVGKFFSSVATVKIWSRSHGHCPSLFFSSPCLPRTRLTENYPCCGAMLQPRMGRCLDSCPCPDADFFCKLPRSASRFIFSLEVNHSGKSDKTHSNTVKLSKPEQVTVNF